MTVIRQLGSLLCCVTVIVPGQMLLANSMARQRNRDGRRFPMTLGQVGYPRLEDISPVEAPAMPPGLIETQFFQIHFAAVMQDVLDQLWRQREVK